MLNYEIREICGDWAIWQQYETDQGGEEKILLILKSRANAEYIKAILEHEARFPNAAVPYRPEVAEMSDEEVLALYKYCTYGFKDNPCSHCPIRGVEIEPCIALQRRVLAIAERVLGDRHDN